MLSMDLQLDSYMGIQEFPLWINFIQFLFLIFVMIIYTIVYLQISLVFFQLIPNFITIQPLIVQIFHVNFVLRQEWVSASAILGQKFGTQFQY